MNHQMTRYSLVQPVTLTTSITTSTTVPYGGFAGGKVYVPYVAANARLTTLTWWTSADGTNWTQEDAGSGTALTTTVAYGAGGFSYPIPLALFGALYIAAVGNTTGSVTFSLKG